MGKGELMKCNTVGLVDQMSHEEWLSQRTKGIGGSDAGVILGVSNWNTPFALWADKRGMVQNEFEGNAATALGSAMEFPILEQYAKDSGQAVVVWKAMVKSEERYWQLANFDAFIVEPSVMFLGGEVSVWEGDEFPTDPLAIVEVKTAGLTGRTNKAAWFSERGCPENYYWQMVHYCAVTGLRSSVMVALVGGEGLLVREYEIPEEDVTYLNEQEAEFWSCVEDGIEPKLTGENADMDTLKSLYPTHEDGKVAAITEFEADIVNEYIEAKVKVDEAEAKLNQVKAELMRIIGDAESVEFEGRTLLTYKATKASETFDAKAFKEANPDLYKQFTKPKAGYRVLRLKGE